MEGWVDKMNLGGDGPFSLREELTGQISRVLNINVITDLLATLASILGNMACSLIFHLLPYLFPFTGGAT